mmetsp:Transcript_15941/g.39170  ORF Transcript_15941/g.39170 Transcript_15941/m.39170 type:complete len:165 (-) Transcript_15941:134-628(-)
MTSLATCSMRCCLPQPTASRPARCRASASTRGVRRERAGSRGAVTGGNRAEAAGVHRRVVVRQTTRGTRVAGAGEAMGTFVASVSTALTALVTLPAAAEEVVSSAPAAAISPFAGVVDITVLGVVAALVLQGNKKAGAARAAQRGTQAGGKKKVKAGKKAGKKK